MPAGPSPKREEDTGKPLTRLRPVATKFDSAGIINKREHRKLGRTTITNRPLTMAAVEPRLAAVNIDARACNFSRATS